MVTYGSLSVEPFSCLKINNNSGQRKKAYVRMDGEQLGAGDVHTTEDKCCRHMPLVLEQVLLEKGESRGHAAFSPRIE